MTAFSRSSPCMTTRLTTWKQIAAFFGTTVRTVIRWEAERGLPVHRLPGEARSRVYADVSELEAWLAREDIVEPVREDAPLAPVEAQPDDPSPVVSPQRRSLARRVMWPVAASAGLVVVIAAVVLSGVLSKPAHTPPAAAQALYMKGIQDWNSRTPEGLSRAVAEFRQATTLDPDYAEAYVGLANCYNLLREYTPMPASQAFPMARAAAEKAIRLNDRLGGAHAALAFALGYGFWDMPGAQREYERALALEPDNSTVEHWYATFLYVQGDAAAALPFIDKALALEPSSRSIAADRAIILFHAGQATEAVDTLTRLTQAEPGFLSPHRYLAQIYYVQDKDGDYLRESEIAARLANDVQGQMEVDAARRGLEDGGHKGFVMALLAYQLDRYAKGTGSAYDVASTYAKAGDQVSALNYLRLAIDRHEEYTLYIKADPYLAPLAAKAGLDATRGHTNG